MSPPQSSSAEFCCFQLPHFFLALTAPCAVGCHCSHMPLLSTLAYPVPITCLKTWRLHPFPPAATNTRRKLLCPGSDLTSPPKMCLFSSCSASPFHKFPLYFLQNINPSMKASWLCCHAQRLQDELMVKWPKEPNKITDMPRSPKKLPIWKHLTMSLKILQAHVLMNANKTGIPENVCPYINSRCFYCI